MISPYGTIQGGSQKVSLILGGVTPIDPRTATFASTGNPADDTEMFLTFNSDPGAYYTLETKPFLESGSWLQVSTVLAVDNVTTILVNRSPTADREFWRVRRGD